MAITQLQTKQYADKSVTKAKIEDLGANKLLGAISAGTAVEIDCTSAGRAILDDADATAQRTTLGLGTAALLDSDTDTTLAANSDTKVATQKAVKAYVDSIVEGLKWKAPVMTASTANVTISTLGDGAAINSWVVAQGERVLLRHQTNPAENGIYDIGPIGGPSTRSADANTGTEIALSVVSVIDGGDAGKTYICTTPSIILGTTGITFSLFSSALGALLAANNLSDLASASTARTNLGLGTAATQNTGTSGSTIPLLNGTNQWSAAQRFINSSGITILDTDASHTLGLIVGSNLTANRTLTVTTGDANRTLTMSGDATISGTNTGDQTITLTGNVTGSGTGSFATTIANDAVTDARLRNSAALSVIGRSANSSGDPADIAASAASGSVLRESGNTIGFGQIATAGITDGAVTLAKQANLAQATIIGRASGAGTGVPQALTGAQVLAVAGIGTRVIREVPTGTMNGTNPTFTLANTPLSGQESVYHNGILLEPGAGNDYTISGGTLTMLTEHIPVSGDKLLVNYWY